jgi:hemerythrin-like domain-containing protein
VSGDPLSELLVREHRALDELFGAYLAALGGAGAAVRLANFDRQFRAHADTEENEAFARLAAAGSLDPAVLSELRLEHTQIRELCAISASRFEAGRPEDARALAGNLARRLAAHEEREEASIFPLLRSALAHEPAAGAKSEPT